MRTLFYRINKRIYNNLKLFWVLTTIALLFVAIAVNNRIIFHNSQKEMKEVTKTISNQIDGFIEALFQEIYTLPVHGKKLTDCTKELASNLQRIVINSPIISGLIIRDNQHKLICSTSPKDKPFVSSQKNRLRTILGPFHLSIYDQPVYLIQQRIGNYYIGIIIISSVLENILQTNNPIVDTIGIHNVYENKDIIRIERRKNHNDWFANEMPDTKHSLRSNLAHTIQKLHSIDDIVVVTFENHHTMIQNLFISQAIMSLIFLFISWFLYLLVRNLFTRHYSLHTAMKLALKNKEFFPVYQPVFDREKDTFTSVEILLRWQDNLDELLLPDFFIEEAENTGLIVPITLEIMKIAFKESKALLKKRPDFHLAFNISALHFRDKTFFNQFYFLMQQYSISPSHIILEITERDLLDINDPVCISKMLELREEGFGLAIDDYGTGHASISYLQHFPFNYLKIDRLFISAIGTKAITESLNDAIIQMAKDLNLMIIAEGVETKEQVQYLLKNEVHFLQGWYFTKALSMEQLMIYLTLK